MPKPKIKHPFYPIIYVRGYAMTKAEIEATVSTPYMGFNLGATKVRQDWRRKVIRHIFESPLVRLMKKYDYRDIYAEGKEMQGSIPAKSIIIHRYYEQADTDLGTGHVPSVIEAAEELHDLIIKVLKYAALTWKHLLRSRYTWWPTPWVVWSAAASCKTLESARP
jgi:hypothetical protein